MKTDIGSRADIEKMVVQFYEAVKADETIGFIFTNLVHMNWEKHIPIIVDFWETILLDNPVYTKNAMEVHYQLNNLVPLQKKHFDSWVHLFTTSIDDLFEGRIAELAKTRARSIAAVMLFKMESGKKGL
jgi:hemoglobin